MQHATFQFTMAGQKKTNPSPIKSICWWNCWEITGCQTWDKCSSAAQCLGRLKRGWVSVTRHPWSAAGSNMAWHMAWRMAKDCPILNFKMTRSITKLQACHGYWISLVCYVLLISSYSFLAPHTVICAPRFLAVCTESITACDRSCRRMLSLVSTVHAAIMWCHLLDQPSASSALIQMATTCLSSFLISSRLCCFFWGAWRLYVHRGLSPKLTRRRLRGMGFTAKGAFALM